MKETAKRKILWLRIFIVCFVYIMTGMTDYPFLYRNAYLCRLWEWVDPVYLFDFVIVGIACCVGIGRQRIREFSNHIFTRESAVVLIINIAFAFSVLKIGALIGNYEINRAGVVYQCILFLGCVGFTEEWIFRGFMVTQLKKVLKSRYAVVLVSSALFALMHLPPFFRWASDPVSLGDVGYRLLIPFLLGVVFSLTFMWKKNLFSLIVIHGVYDLIEQIAFDW
ncbi:MAG: CPBP family intramembrane metalloprotease [Clostridiales bacterium]|nr:CPBP family intramembrane metalloprotease [Clostridiales bacterium]